MVGITGVKGSAVIRIRQNAFNTVLENPSKGRIFQFWPYLPTFVLLKVTCLVTLFDPNFAIEFSILAFFHQFCLFKIPVW